MSDYTPPTLVTPTPGGSPGDGSISGKLSVGPSTSGPIVIDGTAETIYNTNSGGNLTLGVTNNTGGVTLKRGSINVTLYNDVQIYPKIGEYNGVLTDGYGVAPIYGKDVRTGLTAADASALTLYTTTAAGQAYRLMGRILATAGTSPSATYTIKWTEGGATITKTLTISALDADSDLSVLIQPDNGTNITAQLTAISGTGTTVNVAATVEEVA